MFGVSHNHDTSASQHESVLVLAAVALSASAGPRRDTVTMRPAVAAATAAPAAASEVASARAAPRGRLQLRRWLLLRRRTWRWFLVRRSDLQHLRRRRRRWLLFRRGGFSSGGGGFSSGGGGFGGGFGGAPIVQKHIYVHVPPPEPKNSAPDYRRRWCAPEALQDHLSLRLPHLPHRRAPHPRSGPERREDPRLRVGQEPTNSPTSPSPPPLPPSPRSPRLLHQVQDQKEGGGAIALAAVSVADTAAASVADTAAASVGSIGGGSIGGGHGGSSGGGVSSSYGPPGQSGPY
ncbi:hypothetical protein MSG28_012853 [Choristoneura fumiferana]|uniref:Uncharacterized protein n=1 Tax=Choristoneura fumiferana TaxID=7141 RepID=A0ACC0JI89_CHOFU|nr:hypothetical protein MSG28_012853 [Choristoneura fumiferana]